MLGDVQKAAERFGIDSGGVSRADAHAAVGTLSAGIPARAKADGEVAAQVRVLGDEAMSTAAGADLGRTVILADDFDERGETPRRSTTRSPLERQDPARAFDARAGVEARAARFNQRVEALIPYLGTEQTISESSRHTD